MSTKRREIIEDLKKLITSAEEVLDLKDQLRITQGRAANAGDWNAGPLRPVSVGDAVCKLELKKREHERLWNKIKGNYEPFLMEIIQPLPPPYTPQDLQCEPEPEPELQRTRPPKKSTRRGKGNSSTCCGSRPHPDKGARMNKNKQTKKRKKKKQTRRYKKMKH